MSLKDIFKQQSKGMESLATTGTIGMHMVSGPLVGFAIGYGLDAWLETGPWLKLVFLVIGIIAGFMNVYEDTQRLLRKMSREEEQKRAEALADRPERVTVKKKTVVPDSIARADSIAEAQKVLTMTDRQLRKEKAKEERKAAKERRLKEKEERWANLDRRDEEKAKAKQDRKTARLREKKRRLLMRELEQQRKDAEVLQKYLDRLEARQAKKEERLSRRNRP